MAIVRNFNLFLNAGHSIPLVINANQYDQGESWVFTLFNSDGTQYVPSTGAIVGIKSDGLGIINSGSVVDGKVVITETQQMTAAPGKAVFELMIDSGTHGTANFIVLVEPKPGDNADLSETDISMIEQAIEAASAIKPYGSPLVASTVAGMTDHEKVYVYVGSETGYTSGNWYYWDGSAWTSGGVYNSVAVQTDTTLTLSGVAADSKKTGDEISELKRAISMLTSIPYAVKQAMDTLFQNVAFKNTDVYTDELATFHAWASSINVTSITAVYTQGGTVYDYDSLDSLRTDLVVTASYDNGTTAIVSDYTLSGQLTVGTSAITVTYEGKTKSFNVTVTDGKRLYVLPQETSFIASTSIDTGYKFEADNVYTLCLDYTPTYPANSTNYDVLGNRATAQSAYAQISIVKYPSGADKGTYHYGMGISFSNGKDLLVAGDRIRAVVIVDAENFAYTHYFKNVTKGTSNTFNNTSSQTAICRNSNVFLGCAEGSSNTGFIGTMHDFQMYQRQLTADEITAFLNGGN